MPRFEQRRLGPFGGLNQDENPHAILPNELVEARNVVHRGKTLGTRPGMVFGGTEYSEATTGGNPIQGLHEHRENIDEGRLLLAVGWNGAAPEVDNAHVFYDYNSLLSVTADATITSGADNVWTFASHNNNTYAAGGLSRTDDFWYFDGVEASFPPTKIAIVDSAATALYPQFVYAWRNYLFLGGFNPTKATITADNNASTVRFCDFATDPTVPANWKAGNTIGFVAYGTSHNTGISSFRDNSGDYLMLLYNDHIQTVNLDPTSGFNVPFFVSDKIANGCVNQRAYVSLGLDAGDAIYMSERGFHTLKQSQQHGTKSDTFISWKIRPFVKALNRNRMKYAVGAYDFKNGYVLFAVTTGSNTAHDKILCLDVKGEESITAENARWSVWDIGGGKFINELKMCRDESDVWRMHFGTTTGEVGYFNDDVFRDLGASYISTFQTAHDSMGSASTTKNVGDITVTIQPSGSYSPTMNFYFDYGRNVSANRALKLAPVTGAIWGVDLWGVGEWAESGTTWNNKVYGSGSGSTVGFGVSHQGDPFFVSAIDYQVRIIGEDTGDTSSGT